MFSFRMDLIEIMGKHNRKVPVLITPAVGDALKVLVQTRKSVGIPVDNPYIFATVSQSVTS